MSRLTKFLKEKYPSLKDEPDDLLYKFAQEKMPELVAADNQYREQKKAGLMEELKAAREDRAAAGVLMDITDRPFKAARAIHPIAQKGAELFSKAIAPFNENVRLATAPQTQALVEIGTQRIPESRKFVSSEEMAQKVRLEPEDDDWLPTKLGKAAWNVGTGFGSFAATPAGMALMPFGGGGPVAARWAVGASMAPLAAEAATRTAIAIDEGKTQEAIEGAIETAALTSAARHGLSGLGESALSLVSPKYKALPEPAMVAANIAAPGTVRPQEIRGEVPPADLVSRNMPPGSVMIGQRVPFTQDALRQGAPPPKPPFTPVYEWQFRDPLNPPVPPILQAETRGKVSFGAEAATLTRNLPDRTVDALLKEIPGEVEPTPLTPRNLDPVIYHVLNSQADSVGKIRRLFPRAKLTIKEAQVILNQAKEAADAIQKQQAAEVLRDVPEQPREVTREVPSEEGAGRVPPSVQKQAQPEVPLTTEKPAAKPSAIKQRTTLDELKEFLIKERDVIDSLSRVKPGQAVEFLTNDGVVKSTFVRFDERIGRGEHDLVALLKDEQGKTFSVDADALLNHHLAPIDTQVKNVVSELESLVRNADRNDIGDPTLAKLYRQKLKSFKEKIDIASEKTTEKPSALESVRAGGEEKAKQTTEGEKPAAKEIKTELISRLESEIESAPTEAQTKPRSYTTAQGKRVETEPEVKPEKVTIDFPGGVQFTVVKTKENLQSLLSKAKRLSTSTKPPKGYTESLPSKQFAKDAIEEALQKAIDATDPTKGGRLMEGVTGSPVWMTKAIANGALRITLAAYKAGKSVAAAIDEALAWMRKQRIPNFNQEEAIRWLESGIPKPAEQQKPLKPYQPGDSEVKELPVAGGDINALESIPKQSADIRGAIDTALKTLVGRKQHVGGAVKFENSPLPDFQAPEVSRANATQTFGFERIPVLGAAWGGLRRVSSKANDAILQYLYETSVGRAIASALAQEVSWIDKAFAVKDGQISNIGRTKAGQSLFVSDVIEALQKNRYAYKLNEQQLKALDLIIDLEKHFKRLEQKYKIGNVQDNEGSLGVGSELPEQQQNKSYFSRIVVKRPKQKQVGQSSGVGSKAFFEKPRMFDTERQGALAGYVYEPLLSRRIATRAERLYKRMADKRIASDEGLGGVRKKTIESQARVEYAEEIAAGEITETKLQRIVNERVKQGTVNQPAFHNRVFSPEVAKTLNEYFSLSTAKSLRQKLANLNNFQKALWLGYDLGVMFNQGLVLMHSYPRVFAKATAYSLKAMFSPQFFPEYVRRNLEPIREMAQLGSSVGRFEEMLAGAEAGELLHKIPVVKQTLGQSIKPFTRQFQTFLDVGKVEMWKAVREVTPSQDAMRAIQSIESALTTSRMESIGIKNNRALLERVLLIAPSYYRGALNLIAAIGERGVPGKIARRALTGYAVAGTVIFYGLAKALGLSDEEIMKRLSPWDTQFMMLPVTISGRKMEVGYGGIFKGLIKLLGKTAKTAIETPESFKSLSDKKNPLMRFYRGHAGATPQFTWDAITGRDYMGREVDATAAWQRFLPMTAQNALQEDRPVNPTDVAATQIGLSTYERPNAAVQDISRKAREFLESKGRIIPKIEFPEDAPTYKKLREKIRYSDPKGARKVLAEILKTRSIKQVQKAMKQAATRPFTGSKELELEFIKGLSREERRMYFEARQIREQELQAFYKFIAKNADLL